MNILEAVETIDFKKLREEKYAPKTFGQALFPPHAHFNSNSIEEVINEEEATFEVETPKAATLENSEKKVILSSFEKFVSESGDESDDGKEVTFPGGKVVSKELVKDKVFDLSTMTISNGDNVEFFDDYDLNKVKVVFVCEKPKDMTEEGQSLDLLSKMIAAMNMAKEDFLRVFIAKDESPQENCAFIMKKLMRDEPLTVVTMGAFATNSFTRKKDRLSKIHGKLSEFQFIHGEKTFRVSHFPVFHPDLLTINPNMKRSAWIDLQKVMKHVGLS